MGWGFNLCAAIVCWFRFLNDCCCCYLTQLCGYESLLPNINFLFYMDSN